MVIGFAKSKIAFCKDIDLLGYGDRKKGAMEIHDDLYIRCLKIDGIYFVGCDLLGLSREICYEIKRRIVGIDQKNIIIYCTHTHSGPASIFVKTVKKMNIKFIEILKNNIIEVVERAKFSNINVLCNYYESKIKNITYNRISFKQNKKINESIVNTKANILVFQNLSNENIKYIVVNYACHPVCVSADYYYYSNDFIYYIEKELKKKFGTIEFVFWNGCCGNINPIIRGGFHEAKLIGKNIARQIARDILNKKSINIRNVKSILESQVELEYSNRINENYLIQVEKELKQELMKEEVSLCEKERLKRDVIWLERIKEQYYCEKKIDNVISKIKVICLENIIIITLPFEVSNEFIDELKNKLITFKVICICYADGMYGYVMHKKYYDLNIYENIQAYRFYGFPDRFFQTAMDKLLKCVIKNVNNK